MAAVLDAFLPEPDVRKRHAIVVHASAHIVFQVARHFDMQSVPLVRALFRLRSGLLGSSPVAVPISLDPDSLLRMGWETLAERLGRIFIAAAACEPWKADVVFTPIPRPVPDICGGRARQDRLDARDGSPGRRAHPPGNETRAAGTDPAARTRFRRYWRIFGIGIVAIRWLLLPAIRREAERRWRASARRSA